jgi:hypothetical protein
MTKKISLILMLASAGVALSGCGQSEPEKTLPQKATEINRGMKKAQVLEILGTAGSRNFQGSREVIQYCESAFHAAKFVTIYLKDNVVQGMINSDGNAGDGTCSSYDPVDWEKFKELKD